MKPSFHHGRNGLPGSAENFPLMAIIGVASHDENKRFYGGGRSGQSVRATTAEANRDDTSPDQKRCTCIRLLALTLFVKGHKTFKHSKTSCFCTKDSRGVHQAELITDESLPSVGHRSELEAIESYLDFSLKCKEVMSARN